MFAELERSGFHIPVATVASAAFIKKPPEWGLSDHCFLCRQEFNRFKGKSRRVSWENEGRRGGKGKEKEILYFNVLSFLQHHCRNCGKSVCTTCSEKRASLPHFGVNEPTRVCDICYKKVEKG